MKTHHSLPAVALLSLGLLFTGACSSMKGKDLSKTGPTIVDVKVAQNPVELDSNLEPIAPAEVFANVKDISSNITDVKLRFSQPDMVVPMKKVSGTTYRGVLTDQQLKKLAINGQTMKYDAEVVATNAEGKSSASGDKVQISVKAPKVPGNVG